MKKTQKILSVILAILMVISIIPITASAIGETLGTCGDNLTWTFDDAASTLIISGTGEMGDFFDEHSRPWENYHDIENIIINKGVTSIGEFAFSYFTKVTNVIIPEGVTRIGYQAFSNCTRLTSITIPNSVLEIDKSAFSNCTNLTSVTIPNSVTTIKTSVFLKCTNLTSVTIPISVTKIDANAFYFCNSITDVYYLGTEQQWNQISIDTAFNWTLIGATIHYNSTGPHTHDYISVVTVPTCTEQGYSTYTCECGDSYVDDYVDATGHSYTSEITTHATHTETGIETFTCDCGDTYTETIDKLAEHNHIAVVTAPTCTEQGYTTYTCECGDTYIDDYIDATGHTEEIISAVEPTCIETGLTEGAKCSVCGETFTEQKELPANGHTPANAIEENYIAPTCTENGSKDIVIYCSVCDEEISRETVNVDATGHADNDGNGYCDACPELLDPSVECDHACHSDSFFRALFWKIINFFNNLFGLNKTCECGVVHY